jgi:hypothetical protein
LYSLKNVLQSKVEVFRSETWSLALREEHKLRAFENRVLTGIFGPKRDETMRDRIYLQNDMIHNYKNIQIKKDEIAEPVACM